MATDITIDALTVPDSDDGTPDMLKNDPFFSSSSTHKATIIVNYGDVANSAYAAILNVPAVQADTPCAEFLAPFVTPNMTTYSQALTTNHSAISIAPWTPDNGCVQGFIDQASQFRGTLGFIFFVPNSTGTPPDTQSSQWTINGSMDWQAGLQFPVFALDGTTGGQIMERLGVYSQNLSNLESQADRGWLRAQVTPDSFQNHLPSIWYFLLIILCVLLGGVALVSGAMHFIQRRHRATLQRRIARGEINVEQLGIRQVRVPPEVLAKLPLYTYTASKTSTIPGERSAPDSAESSQPTNVPEVDGIQPSAPAAQDVSLTGQDTCAICLDDYEANKTVVRELPCRHIFHPDCIDPFLRENSNLCPLCKSSVLANFSGYAPQVTNAMVRRERMIRARRDLAIRTAAIRERFPEEAGPESSSTQPSARAFALAARLPRSLQPIALRHYPPAHRGASSQSQSIEMSAQNAPSEPTDGQTLHSVPAIQPSGSAAPPPGPSRREWARQRAVRMLGTHPTVEDEQIEQDRRRPAWRRAMRSVFPSTSAT